MTRFFKLLFCWGVPIIGALVALAVWGAIFWYMVTTSERKLVQYNPVNNQDQVANDLAGDAAKYHGFQHRPIMFKFEKVYGVWEYGFYRYGKWCSLYRSLPILDIKEEETK